MRFFNVFVFLGFIRVTVGAALSCLLVALRPMCEIWAKFNWETSSQWR